MPTKDITQSPVSLNPTTTSEVVRTRINNNCQSVRLSIHYQTVSNWLEFCHENI